MPDPQNRAQTHSTAPMFESCDRTNIVVPTPETIPTTVLLPRLKASVEGQVSATARSRA